VNITERQLSEVLHRVTPEPPRGVTVEDVAIRLANQAGRTSYQEPRRRRGPGRGRAWAPVLAAASVFVVAGASAGIAVLATSHHSPSPPVAGTSALASSGSSPTPSSSHGATQPAAAIPGGPWSAALITRQMFTQGTLVSGDNSLYALEAGALVRIDPATGAITQTVPYSPPVPNPPVVMGNTVWVVSAYSGGSIVLHGYDAQTLAQVASFTVPAIGQVSSTAQGVLAAGPDGNLYLAAGDTVTAVNPATGQVVNRIFLTSGPADSVAVSPDGSKVYVATSPSGSFRLWTYDLASGTVVASSSLNIQGVGGNLVATSGGVWGTLGTGMTQWVWFAPDGNLSRSVRVGQSAGGGLELLPTVSGGAVWIGGSHALTCASPATGQVLASATIPADNGVAEYYGSAAVVGGQAYSYYQNQAARQYGVARMNPPAACTGGGS
jgi:PQQ-like domain